MSLKLIIWIHEEAPGAAWCFLCGALWHEKIVAELHEGTTHIGNVCPSCLDAGVDGAVERSRKFMEYLSYRIAKINELTGKLETLPQWPSNADIHRIAEEQMEEAKKPGDSYVQ